MSHTEHHELTDVQVAEGCGHVRAALVAARMGLASGHHLPEHSHEDIERTVRFVAAMVPRAAGGLASFDWGSLVPLILQILAILGKKGPAPA